MDTKDSVPCSLAAYAVSDSERCGPGCCFRALSIEIPGSQTELELRDALLHLSADTGQFCVSNEREKRKNLLFSLFWENALHYPLELFPA